MYLNITNAAHAGMFKVMYDYNYTQHSSNNGITHQWYQTVDLDHGNLRVCQRQWKD